MTESPLAQIVRVLLIEPIFGADKIELVSVLGWKVITRKGEYQIGDLAIYFSINSILPNEPQFEFLKGKPLKTVKMRGVISQGLMGPLIWLPKGLPDDMLKEGTDVTTIMNIKKWIPKEEEELYVKDKEGFPINIRKTDEPRIQNCCKNLNDLLGANIIITQKYDGTSTTFAYSDNKFKIYSRNFLLQEGKESQHYYEIAKRYDLETKMSNLGKNIAIQGELIGPKINCNRHNVKENEYYVFNIFDIDRQYYMTWDELLVIASNLGLKTVPVVYRGLMKVEYSVLSNLLDLASSQKYSDTSLAESSNVSHSLDTAKIDKSSNARTSHSSDLSILAEGIVVKTDLPYGFPRISFKVISNEYLLKHKL